MQDRTRTPQEIIDYHLGRCDAQHCPTFLAIASWFALHNSYCAQKPMEDIINPADGMNDYSCSPDGLRLFSFESDATGLNALRQLRGLIDCETFIHDGAGNYVLADDDLIQGFALDKERIDISDPSVIQDFIRNFIKDDQQQRYPVMKPR